MINCESFQYSAGRRRYTSLTLPLSSTSVLKTLKEANVVQTRNDEEEDEEDIYQSEDDEPEESILTSANFGLKCETKTKPISRSSSSSSSSESSESDKEELEKSGLKSSDDEDEHLIASIHLNHIESKNKLNELVGNRFSHSDDDDDDETNNKNALDENEETAEDHEEFQFDLPFSDIMPFNSNKEKTNVYQTANLACPIGKHKDSPSSVNRQLIFDKNNRRLQFQPKNTQSDEDGDEDELGIGSEYNRRKFCNNQNDEDDEDDDNDEDLLRDFDVIDVIPGFGEPPRNNQEFEIKLLKTNHYYNSDNRPHFTVKEDHFKKPLTKIDVLKAPDSYPCPINVYCVQEISINWCMYGGNDFSFSSNDESTKVTSPVNPQPPPPPPSNKINRTASSPIIVQSHMLARSRNNSTSSSVAAANALSLSPQQYFSIQSVQSPPKHQLGATSPSGSSGCVKFTNRSTVSFNKAASGSINEKYLQRKAGGRIKNKYDTKSLNWMARGGKSRNLDVCMEIALYKVKTKIDIYSDLNAPDANDSKEANKEAESPYLYRVALAIGDTEIRDKLASSPFNMFLFRYESDHCPKHTNSNMFFLKFLCSKSMDAQRLLECDIKVSIQPLRFNIDQDALIFMVEFFTKLASKDLNEFSKNLLPPPPPATPPTCSFNETNESNMTASTISQLPQSIPPPLPPPPPIQTPQQVFIRNFIFSPDLLVRFDFSGKYDSRSETKMDTLTKMLMVAIQLSNTEIKLKRICYRRGFLGAEKLLQALVKEWLNDIQRNQMKNLIKGWGIFNSLIQFFEGFTYLIWYPIEQYRKDGRVLCGLQKGSAAFSTCTVLATIELTNRIFQTTKNVAEFFYDMVTPHRANSHHHHNLSMLVGYNGANNGLVETILTGVGNNRNIRLRRHPNDIREGFTNAYYVMYEGFNDAVDNLIQEISQGSEHKGISGAIGGALRQLPSTALAVPLLGADATCNILSGIRNQLKPDEKRDDDQKWKTIAHNS